MIKVKFNPKDVQKILAIPGGIEKAIVATTVELFADVVEDTPIDTGFARASWFVAVNGEGGHPEPPEPNKEPASVPMPAYPAEALLGSAGKRIVIANSAAYIRRLEYDGWSPQNSLWITRAVAKYPLNFRRNIKKILGKAV